MENAKIRTPQLPKDRFTSIPLKILVFIAWRNLTTKKLRTFLTLFGVIIGIGSIFFLLSFGLGLQNLVTKQIIGNQSIKTIDVSTPNSRILKLNRDSAEKIRNLPHITQVGLSYSFPGSLARKGGEIDTIVYGVDQNYQALDDLTTSAGRLLKNTDDKAILLNEAAVKAVGISDARSAIGKQAKLLVPLQNSGAKVENVEDTYTIKGVVSTGAGSEVYVPSFVFDLAGVSAYSQLRLVVDDTKNIAGLRQQIESLGFQTSSPSDTIDQVNQIFKFFNIILIGFGAIGMIVAVLGMFNTLTISLLERTKEIGLMLAMGGRNRDMSKLFIFEALLLSLAGAITGILLAAVLGRLVNAMMINFAHRRGVQGSFELFATPLWLIASLTGFMAAVGLLVAFFPAKRAQRIDPIDALRRE